MAGGYVLQNGLPLLGRKPKVIYFCAKGNAEGNSVLNAVIPLKVTE